MNEARISELASRKGLSRWTICMLADLLVLGPPSGYGSMSEVLATAVEVVVRGDA